MEMENNCICDSKLVVDFFYKFMRFEYAMKMVGYLKEKDVAEPDWKRLANIKTLQSVFKDSSLMSEEFKNALTYFKEYPPEKQMVENGDLVWQHTEPDGDSYAEKTLVLVRRVRNNLFHGGKFRDRYLDPPERNEDLMKHSLVILDRCLSAMPDVKKAYDG